MQAENDAPNEIIDETIKETLTELGKTEPANLKSTAQPVTVSSASIQGLVPEYNGVDRNAWLFGFNPQQELWNGRLAMIGFVAYLLWDLGGYSVVRDALHWVR